MFAITKWSQDRCTKRIMYLKRKKRKVHKSSLHPSKDINTPPIKKSYINSPLKYMTTFNQKLLPLDVTNDKGQVTEKRSSPYH